MKRTKKREIVVERDQVVVIRQFGDPAPQCCPVCGQETRMVSVDQAAAIVGLSSRAIYQQVEGGQIHFSETTDGLLLICLNSLLK